MNKIEALKAWFGTDVPEQLCRHIWPVHGKRFQKKGNRKTRGQEGRIKDAGLHSSEQVAFHGTCLSGWFKVRRYLLLVTSGRGSHLRWQSFGTEVE